MKIAIVILNWNGRKLLEQFLPKVVAYSQPLATVYLADNASTDDSVSWCTGAFPSVQIVQNDVNGGYAKGYNDALKYIDADLYILLNSDVQVTENWLEPIIKRFEQRPDLAAAQPKIKDLKNPTLFEYAGASGGYVDALGYPYCRGRIFDHCEEDVGQYDNEIDVHWASGACLFIRSTVFWEVGGLDESFFAHQEEIDLCWRVKNKGYRVMAIPTSEVFHLGGATLSKANPQKTYYNFRNTLFAIVKNVSGTRHLFLIFVRLLLDGLAAIKFLFDGKPKHVLAILNAHTSFYAHLPSLYKKRRDTQRTKKYTKLTSVVYNYYMRGIREFSKLPHKR